MAAELRKVLMVTMQAEEHAGDPYLQSVQNLMPLVGDRSGRAVVSPPGREQIRLQHTERVLAWTVSEDPATRYVAEFGAERWQQTGIITVPGHEQQIFSMTLTRSRV